MHFYLKYSERSALKGATSADFFLENTFRIPLLPQFLRLEIADQRNQGSKGFVFFLERPSEAEQPIFGS